MRMVLQHNRVLAVGIIVLANPMIGAWQTLAEAVHEGEVSETRRPVTTSNLDSLTIRRTWRQYWQRFGARSATLDGKYYTLPKFDKKYPSSAHITPKTYRRKNSQKLQHFDRNGRATQKVFNEMPLAKDAEVAAHVIPKVAVGEYGYIHSIQIERIIGPREMMGTWPWLLDQATVRRDSFKMQRTVFRNTGFSRITTDNIMEVRYKAHNVTLEYQKVIRAVRIHFIGLNTKGLAAGIRWTGPQGRGIHIAIVGLIIDSRKSNVDKFVAIPVKAFGRGLNEEKFELLLEDRGFDVASFCELIIEEKKNGPREFEERVIMVLEASHLP